MPIKGNAISLDLMREILSMRTRRSIARQRVRLRQLTAGWRELPNVLIIGAQRCGTSSLFKYLGQHPQVSASIRKEVEYFTLHFDRNESWYRAHFLTAREQAKGEIRTIFEATPNYIFDPRCAERAAFTLPGARIIALLRDPVDRAFSNYQHNRRLHHEPLSFPQAIERETKRTREAWSQLALDPTIPFPMSIRRYSYVERGFYARQLLPWFEHFGHERVLVVASDDFYRDTRSVFRDISSFLELPDWVPKTFDNRSYVGRKKGTLTDEFPAALRAELVSTFARANRQLEELLCRDLNWSRPATADPTK